MSSWVKPIVNVSLASFLSTNPSKGLPIPLASLRATIRGIKTLTQMHHDEVLQDTFHTPEIGVAGEQAHVAIALKLNVRSYGDSHFVWNKLKQG